MTRREDNLRLEGEFIRKVPEKWEPGQRAAIIRQRDNLQPPGPVEDTRDRGPKPTVGDRAPMVRPGDNLRRLSGDFERRTVAEWSGGERVQAVRQADSLRMEGDLRWPHGAGSLTGRQQRPVAEFIDRLTGELKPA